MARKKKVILGLLVSAVVIQFIQPSPNRANGPATAGLTRTFHTPSPVAGILRRSCYDCHSNTTQNPWYSYVQPVGWWMEHHVNEGKDELNFDEIGTYSARKQQSKLRAMIESIKEESMPLPSYTWLHRNAKLSQHEKELVVRWAQGTLDSLSTTNNL